MPPPPAVGPVAFLTDLAVGAVIFVVVIVVAAVLMALLQAVLPTPEEPDVPAAAPADGDAGEAPDPAAHDLPVAGAG